MEEILSASIYAPIYNNLILLLVLMKCTQLYQNNKLLWYGSSIFLVLFLGLRPISEQYFGDTLNYAIAYENVIHSTYSGNELVFNWLQLIFVRMGFSVHCFFLFVETVYIGCHLWACKRIFNKYGYLAFLVVISTFSFYSYGINGIRNGMAAAIMVLALSYIETSKKKALLWAFIAIYIHNSMLLLIVVMVVCLLYNNTKYYFYFWLLSIAISAIIGNAMEKLIAGFSIIGDERFSGYLTGRSDAGTFAIAGFRWDFLLYSSVPILIGYYYVVKRGFRDKTYLFFLNTYILANSFWVMVIRANFSNRFAYLSWFLYGIVLVYPFLKSEYVKGRDTKLRLVLLGNMAFTYLMWLIGK